MQRLMKCCARGALGLGAAALLLAGVPAHAGPAYCESVLAPADASRDSQPLRLAQSAAQPEEAEKLEQRRLKEQQEREKMQQQEQQQRRRPDMKKMGGPMPEAAPSAPAAIPSKPGTSRFGAGVIRDKESADGD